MGVILAVVVRVYCITALWHSGKNTSFLAAFKFPDFSKFSKFSGLVATMNPSLMVTALIHCFRPFEKETLGITFF